MSSTKNQTRQEYYLSSWLSLVKSILMSTNPFNFYQQDRLLFCVNRVSVPITADRKSRRLLKIKKKIARWKSRRELIFKAVFGIN